MATAPTLGVVSPALQPRHQHPHSAVLACGGRGRGREGCMPQLLGKGWAVVARETGFSAARMPVIVSSHTVNPCLGRSKGCAILSVSPPTPASVSGSFWGSPTSVPMVWGILECLGNQGRLGLHTGGGMETRGCTQTLGYTRAGEGLVGGSRGWGVSWGPRQLAEPGSREGPGQS